MSTTGLLDHLQAELTALTEVALRLFGQMNISATKVTGNTALWTDDCHPT